MYLSILSILALIVGLIGIFLAVIFYLKSKKVKKLIYMFETTEIISKSKTVPEDIEILYKNKKVDRVSKTIVIIWNNGRETIDYKDIVYNHPIEIVFPNDIKILRAEILKIHRKDIIDIKTNITSHNKVQVNFNFLDYNDGALIEIIHTGDNVTEFNTEGVIKGSPKGIINKGKLARRRNRKIAILRLLIIPVIAISFYYGPKIANYLEIYYKLPQQIIAIILVTIIILPLILFDFFAFRLIKIYPKKLEP